MSREVCKYINSCPSVSGWCIDGLQPSEECINFILCSREREVKINAPVAYVCDRRACEHCDKDCEYTTDPRHAKNFSLERVRDRLVLMERKKQYQPTTGVDCERGSRYSVGQEYLEKKSGIKFFDTL